LYQQLTLDVTPEKTFWGIEEVILDIVLGESTGVGLLDSSNSSIDEGLIVGGVWHGQDIVGDWNEQSSLQSGILL